jgi:DNA-binding transcriptional ArsR family regulator
MPLSLTIQALSDQNRRKILDLLKKTELSAGDINKKLAITGATLSHHLDVLKRAELISGRKDGQQVIYSLNLSVFEEAAEQLIKFFQIKPKSKSAKPIDWHG